MWILHFFIPECEKCQALVPVWNKIATELGNDVVVAALDGIEHGDLLQAFGVEDVPAFIAFSSESPDVYEGQNNYKALLKWAKAFTTPTSKDQERSAIQNEEELFQSIFEAELMDDIFQQQGEGSTAGQQDAEPGQCSEPDLDDATDASDADADEVHSKVQWNNDPEVLKASEQLLAEAEQEADGDSTEADMDYHSHAQSVLADLDDWLNTDDFADAESADDVDPNAHRGMPAAGRKGAGSLDYGSSADEDVYEEGDEDIRKVTESLLADAEDLEASFDSQRHEDEL